MVIYKKGAILIVVMVFMITALIMSFALYNSVYNLFKIQGVKEIRWGRGYYLASAGLTYASMLLKDPVVYAGFSADPPLDGESAPQKTLTSDANTLGSNLGLTGSQKITIRMTYYATTKKYTTTSTYSD